MEPQAWIVLGLVIVLIAAMVREVVPPAIAMFGATMVLFLAGIITADEAFAGFSNEAPFVIAALLVIARAVDAAGIVQPLVDALFSNIRSTRALLARLLFPLAAGS